MMNGGASLEYFKRLADDPKNTILFVGYNSSNSLGRRIQNGVKEVSCSLTRTASLLPVKVNMNVKTVEGFSGHSDRQAAHKLRGEPEAKAEEHIHDARRGVTSARTLQDRWEGYCTATQGRR